MVLQNGVGQIHNVVHPNPTQKSHNHWNIFKQLFKTQILQELFFFLSVLHKNHHLFFCFTLTDRFWTHWKFLQKAGSGVVVLQNGVGQIHNVVHPNHAQKILNDWNTFKNRFLSQVLEEFFLFLTYRCFESSGVRPQALTTHPNQQLKMQPNSFV